ncbi:spore coat protein U domain-containing protein [Deinococcus indicus]|nr:spore coat protein U domain-containing protein [Deinococcus indicus]
MKNTIAMTALTLIASTGMAASVSTTFTSAATVQNSCTISTVGLDFGGYMGASTNAVTAGGKVTTTCTKNAVFALNYSGFTGKLTKAGGTDTLDYAVSTSNVEGNFNFPLTANQNGSALPYWILATGTDLIWPVTGTIAPNQWGASAGNYNEVITFTVDY